ncbi:MAG: hypothetical protein AAF629_05635 [Chloroflexota bacterium]
MTIKKFTIAVVVAFIISNILNTIYYAVTAAGHVWEMTKAEPNYPLLMLNHLVFVLLLAYVYPIGYKGGSPIAEGARFGALMGLIMFVPTGLVVRAAWEVPITPYFLADIVFHTLATAIMGISIAFVYGREDQLSDKPAIAA